MIVIQGHLDMYKMAKIYTKAVYDTARIDINRRRRTVVRGPLR